MCEKGRWKLFYIWTLLRNKCKRVRHKYCLIDRIFSLPLRYQENAFWWNMSYPSRRHWRFCYFSCRGRLFTVLSCPLVLCIFLYFGLPLSVSFSFLSASLSLVSSLGSFILIHSFFHSLSIFLLTVFSFLFIILLAITRFLLIYVSPISIINIQQSHPL